MEMFHGRAYLVKKLTYQFRCIWSSSWSNDIHKCAILRTKKSTYKFTFLTTSKDYKFSRESLPLHSSVRIKYSFWPCDDWDLSINVADKKLITLGWPETFFWNFHIITLLKKKVDSNRWKPTSNWISCDADWIASLSAARILCKMIQESVNI